MLALKQIVSDLPSVQSALQKRGKTFPALNSIAAMDKERREHILVVEGLKAQRNAASQQIANLKRSGADASQIIEKMQSVGIEIKRRDERLEEIETKLNQLIAELPNLPHLSVPTGSANVQVRKWGEIPKFDFTLKTHDEIGEALGILDFKKAGEVAGSRFCYLKTIAARIERALISFMLDTHREKGYDEMSPPYLVNRKALTGTGQLPKFEEDVFHIEKSDFFLIPTAEVPVTNYHRDEILDWKQLPIKYAAYTPCFRSEAGSHGKDTKGLKRQHQFAKVELVKFAMPETSNAEHEALTADAERILQLLKIPYRVMLLCGADLGFGASKTYDIEVWSPGINDWMEISSCSNFTDFQARRANIRFRDRKGEVHHVHTLNGSGLAVGRTLIALMENYQRADGTFDLPEVLQPYFEMAPPAPKRKKSSEPESKEVGAPDRT